METDTALVAQTVEAVQRATSLDEALDALVKALRSRFDLWHASISSHLAGAPQATILARWSLRDSVFEDESAFEDGVEVSVTISKTVATALETLWEGHGATFAVGADPDSIFDHLLREQGVAAVLVLPIHRDEKSLLILSLGTSSPDAFRDVEAGFFSRLTTGTGDTFLRLATAVNDT